MNSDSKHEKSLLARIKREVSSAISELDHMAEKSKRPVKLNNLARALAQVWRKLDRN